jgi:WD40 repeat protein/serine/threonine protein kinase/DNA-binding XRE family transcriptional regulator
MNQDITFGQVVKERRYLLGLTQAELGRRVGCAAITIRKIEADALRPSVQIAERLAVALNIPEAEHLAFVRLARADQESAPLPTPQPALEEIGQEDLSGRAIRGYELAERIGAGGYGVVYRAVQPTVNRDVAVKIILPHYADQPEFIRRFEAEAQLVARLEHPHIVPLYDYWREPGVAYLIMRLLAGGSLETLLKDGPLAEAMILRIMEQICAGLHAAHRAGVVHRDLKPANILLDGDGNAYLADFGIAKHIGNRQAADATREGVVIGSPAYIAPEQILAEPVKPQTDIYSLGVILYELLTGRKPFKGPTPVAFIQQHLNERLPLLAAQNGGDSPPSDQAARSARLISSTGYSLPTALDIVIGRATAKEPRERYPDIVSMLADIRRAMTPGAGAAALAAGQAVEAMPPHVATMIALPDLENPYKGLRPFTEADAGDFFGRETLIQELLARLAQANDPSAGPGQDLARFLAVVGPSGSGKSSVVRAGLIPALRRGGLPGSEHWFVAEMLPGQHPFAELETALQRIAINPPPDLPARLRQDERGLLQVARRILPADQAIELLLVIDQFEEIFTLVQDEETRARFLNSLVTATLDPDSRLRLVITLRADFTDQPLRYVDFGELVRQRAEFVLPLTPDELEQAIVNPTEQAGLSLEAGLAQTIMRDIGDQPGMLPLLQYALTELFERRQGRLLTLQAYRESGGVLGALARRAEELYAGLDDAGREMTRQLFLRLVTLGEGVEDTRRRVLRAELEALTADGRPPTAEASAEELAAVSAANAAHLPRQRSAVVDATAIAQVIETFGRYRLLTFDHDPVSRGPTIEVAHEALLREWGRLREWLAASRTDIRLQRLLASAAAEWIQANRDPGYLLRGGRLNQFEGWAASTALALTYEERTFLRTSLAARRARRADEEIRQRHELETAQKLAQTEAQSARRLRWLALGLTVFLVVALGLTWFAFNQRNTAQDNFVTAERIRLAAQAQIALDNGEGGDLPALLALRSLQHGYSPEADAALVNALTRGFTRQRYLGHANSIAGVAFSPDGRYIITASYDHTARLWDAQTGLEIRRFAGHTDFIYKATFSPNGRYALTSSSDRTARVWDVQTGQEVRRFSDHTDEIWDTEFSPDGRYVVVADGALARLWDFQQTGQEVRQFTGHTDTIFGLNLSPDGRYLATMSSDKTARLWDVQTGQEVRQFTGHTDTVGDGAFSPDSQYLLTTSLDRTARLWDVQTGVEIRRFVGHTDFIYDGQFSPDGRYALTGSNDKTARLWDVQTGQEMRRFIGHTSGVWPSAYSPNGQYVLTGSPDRTARLWDVWIETEPRRLRTSAGHVINIYSVALSPDGRYVLTGDEDQSTVRLWNIQTGQIAHQITLEAVTINAQVLSPDNKFVLTGGGDGTVRLWETETGQEVRQFSGEPGSPGHAGPVWDVVFSTDGRAALSGSEDQTARLWDVQTGREVRQFSGHSGPVRGVAFSTDGRYILTGSDDQTARLWDAQTGQELRQFIGHSEPILDVAFSADGRFILTGSEDNTARLWQAETGQQVHLLLGHTDQVAQVAFSPDGRYLLTGSSDQTARLWDAGTGQLARQLGGHTSSLLFASFSADGEHILTSDIQAIYLWRTTLEAVVEFACAQLSRDFTAEERTLYNITGNAPTCAEFSQRSATPEPTWTPVPPGAIPVSTLALAPAVQSASQVVEMEFLSEAGNIQMGLPIQDAYIDVGNGQVMRPQVLNAETLALPVYRSAVEVELDFLEAPFDAGPYAKGEPLGFTLGDYIAATGHGTYTVQGNRAVIDLTFDKLVPNGVYTVWCNEFTLPPHTKMVELPCGAPDGSENTFIADEKGHLEITMDIEAFPPSTKETFYEIALAYHSDGQTHGSSVGQHGLNAHGQIYFDFMAPADE